MTTKFLPKLSQNYIELLANDEYYDVTIEIGEDPNVKILRAHMNILSCRSPYLRRTLAFNNRSNNTSDLVIKLPNISLKTFQIILKYIYGGVLSLNEQDNSEIFEVLLAADKLLIQELVDYLQKYLIENKSEWMEQHFELVHRTSFQSNSLLVLQQFCTDFMVKSSEKIFKLLDFTSLSEKSLIQLIKRNDLQMKEIEVWEHVLKWGLAQNPTLNPDPTTCNPTNDILLPRNLKIDGIINSSIINNLSIISTISRRLDKMDIKKDIKSVIISNIKDKKHAFYCGADYGPDFGDIIIFSYKDEYRDYKHSYYQKRHYEKKITDIVDKFSIEDYEVFQIIK
ncbi:BTB/POZ protein [Rhizophagus irregularis DAOM 181602=DAOM 197198]|nr:BTB/POZ protein [Rhizophagus irregularis DAOM 181602=DAOM 197198]